MLMKMYHSFFSESFLILILIRIELLILKVSLLFQTFTSITITTTEISDKVFKI